MKAIQFSVLLLSLVALSSSCTKAKDVIPVPPRTSEEAVAVSLNGQNELSGDTVAVEGEPINGHGFALSKSFKFSLSQKSALSVVASGAVGKSSECGAVASPLLFVSKAGSDEAIEIGGNAAIVLESGDYQLAAIVSSEKPCAVSASFQLKQSAADDVVPNTQSETTTSTDSSTGETPSTDTTSNTATDTATTTVTDTGTSTSTDVVVVTPVPTPVVTPVPVAPVLNGKYDTRLRGIWEDTAASSAPKAQLYIEDAKTVEHRIIANSAVVAKIKYKLDMDEAQKKLVLIVSEIEGAASEVKVGDFQACLYSFEEGELHLACSEVAIPSDMSSRQTLKKVNDPYSYLGFLIQRPYYRFYQSTHSCGMTVAVSGNTVTTKIVPESGVSSSQCQNEVITYTCNPFENKCTTSGKTLYVCANGDFHVTRYNDARSMRNRMYFGAEGPTAQGTDDERYQACELDVPLVSGPRKEIDAALVPKYGSRGYWSYTQYGSGGRTEFSTKLSITTGMTGSETSSTFDEYRIPTVVEDFDFTIVSDRTTKSFVRKITKVRAGRVKVGDVHSCTYRAWYYGGERLQFSCSGGASSSHREFIMSY